MARALVEATPTRKKIPGWVKGAKQEGLKILGREGCSELAKECHRWSNSLLFVSIFYHWFAKGR